MMDYLFQIYQFDILGAVVYNKGETISLKSKGLDMNDKTTTEYIPDERRMRQILIQVYDALCEKGYDPYNQIVGYILSEDPTYITSYNNARSLIRKIDREMLLQVMVKGYLDN